MKLLCAMSGKPLMLYPQVLHQAVLKVDENGTEAAAATTSLHQHRACALFSTIHPEPQQTLPDLHCGGQHQEHPHPQVRSHLYQAINLIFKDQQIVNFHY